MRITDNCLGEFSLMQQAKTQGIYVLDGESLSILSVEEHNPNASWDRFVELLPRKRCAHAFTHFYYLSETDNVQRRKFVHIQWIPSDAPAKEKMQFTFFAAQDLLELGALGVGAATLEAVNMTELSYPQAKENIVRRLTVK